MHALASLAAADERGEDRTLGVKARCQIGDGDADLDWLSVAMAGNVNQARLGLADDVVARILCVLG